MKNILYTGTNPKKYESLGRVIHWPMIEITKTSVDGQTVTQLRKNLGDYNIILFTSRFAVEYFFEFLKEYGISQQPLKSLDFAVIGDHTAKALRNYRYAPVLVASDETSEDFFKALVGRYSLRDKKILFPRSSLLNPFLQNALRKCGALVDVVAIYQNVKPPKRDLPKAAIDGVIFTSPSTVINFLEDYKSVPAAWEIFSKGPLTRKVLKELGFESEIIK